MDWAVAVVIIVVIGAITSTIQAAIGARRTTASAEPAHLQASASPVREEVRMLKERVAVLERIATDRNHLLEQEFDRLRDR
jgi:hypothetical protein